MTRNFLVARDRSQFETSGKPRTRPSRHNLQSDHRVCHTKPRSSFNVIDHKALTAGRLTRLGMNSRLRNPPSLAGSQNVAQVGIPRDCGRTYGLLLVVPICPSLIWIKFKSVEKRAILGHRATLWRVMRLLRSGRTGGVGQRSFEFPRQLTRPVSSRSPEFRVTLSFGWQEWSATGSERTLSPAGQCLLQQVRPVSATASIENGSQCCSPVSFDPLIS